VRICLTVCWAVVLGQALLDEDVEHAKPDVVRSAAITFAGVAETND
jgi:hypothetical protein